ncbi:HD domain-containing protein [Geobacillus subterraneus]|nr:HD domain-containing protein [Geobacillus subterraneus]
MEQIVAVKNLKLGEKCWIRGRFSKKEMKTKKGDPYFLVKIKDGTGVVMQQVWSNLDIAPAIENLKDNDLIEAEVSLSKDGKFRNVFIHSIVRIDALEHEGQEEKKNENQLLLDNVVQQLSDPYRELIRQVFQSSAMRDFVTSPASMMSGYSYRGGLLEHTMRLTKLAQAVLPLYESTLDINRDLLLTACILHDVGKVFSWREQNGRVEKTHTGELFEDSYVTLRFLFPFIQRSALTKEEKVLLEHVIGAAKGKQEYGALHIPRSKEAVLLHHLDALDVQMAHFEFLHKESNGEKFVRLFQKTLFLGF